jgi:hypothetical protein
MRPTGEPPRDYIDRMMRDLLGRQENLADFVRDARPRLAPGFVFEQAHPASREFLIEDWRRREADLLFEIPYHWAERQTEVLVWILLEHQSDTDTLVPLRMLLETVMAWSRQWQGWREAPPPRGTLRLRPVVPIVLYTADLPWGSNETIRDLVDAPPELMETVPNWGPIFWNLSERTPAHLLGGGPFMQILAAMRVAGAETAVFEEVYRRASSNLASLAATQMVRWQELIQALLSFGQRRRPPAEREALIEIVRETNGPRQNEVTAMAQTIAEDWMEQGEVRGGLRWLRRVLRHWLEQNHGHLPESILQRIEACNDLQRLEQAVYKAPKLAKLEDLEL